MKCPNCEKEMIRNKKTILIPDFGGTADEALYEHYLVYTCKECHIKYTNYINGKDKWEIPFQIKPTEKQINTIFFINNHLDLSLKTLTKKQCWKDINTFFDTAKTAAQEKKEDYIQNEVLSDHYYEMLDFLDESDFF